MLEAMMELQQLLETKSSINNTSFYNVNVIQKKEKVKNKKLNRQTNNNIKDNNMLTYEINENTLDDNDLGNGLDVQASYLDDAQAKENEVNEEQDYYNVGLDNHNELQENKEY